MDDEGDDLSNVIAFPDLKELRESGGPVSTLPTRYADCSHRHGVSIDAQDRVVYCKRCDKPMDAFEALSNLARHWDWKHTRDAKKNAQEELAIISSQLEKLKQRRSRAVSASAVSMKEVRRVLTTLRERLKREEALQLSKGRKEAAKSTEHAEFLVRCAEQEFRIRLQAETSEE